MIYYWYLTIDSNVIQQFPQHTRLLNYNYIFNFINETLNDPRGWMKHGYTFQPIFEKPKINEQNKVHVRMSLNETIKRICNLDGLSCAEMSKTVSQNIYINAENWLYGSKQSGLSPRLGRLYIISHEFGHILGRNHKSCSSNKNEKCSIMYQQTVSKGCCKPNAFVLDTD